MATKLRIHQPETAGGTAGDTVGIAAAILLRAFDSAHELHSAVWEFAVEVRALENAGVAVTDLRWLVGKGYAEHGSDETRHSARRRHFRRARHLTFTDKSCFVLTAHGAGFARALLRTAVPRGSQRMESTTVRTGDTIQGVPVWDRERRELRYAGVVVKQFKEPARNQETILAAFEEEKWRRQIDDPLPPRTGTSPPKRVTLPEIFA